MQAAAAFHKLRSTGRTHAKDFAVRTNQGGTARCTPRPHDPAHSAYAVTITTFQGIPHAVHKSRRHSPCSMLCKIRNVTDQSARPLKISTSQQCWTSRPVNIVSTNQRALNHKPFSRPCKKKDLPFTKHHFTTHSAYPLKIRVPIQEP